MIGSVSEGAISIDFALICGYYGYMFNTPLQKQQSKLHGYFFSSLRTTPESENSKLFFFFFPQFAVFHLFCFLGGEEIEVQTVPSEIQAQGKETPNESISIFYKNPFLDHREYIFFIF